MFAIRASCIPCLEKSKEGARPKDDADERAGWVHTVEDVTVDADEQMLEKLDNGSRTCKDIQRRCASTANETNVLSNAGESGASESGKQKCSELECEEVSFCDSSESASLPT
mmetsp:Transcript_60527/g.126668  ORF Transcript_60527/g.126668 Transcript_60527/m.126668 type:complete len:112 (-) Transcript_60527:93-428(-)